MALSVDEGVGPRFPRAAPRAGDFERLRDPTPEEDLGYVLEALRLARRELAGRVPLIGFAGAPWTLMSYMVEGQGSKSFTMQAAAGAGARAGPRPARATGPGGGRVSRGPGRGRRAGGAALRLLGERPRPAGLPRVRPAVPGPRRRGSRAGAGAPVIVFAPGAGWALEEIAAATGRGRHRGGLADRRRGRPPPAAGHRWRCRATSIRAGSTLRRPVSASAPTRMLAAFGGRRHIANLGHGIIPDVPVAHARAFVDAVQGMARAVSEPGPVRVRVSALMERLHDETTVLFTRLDRGGAFREDRWERPGGGGGVAPVLTDGTTFEKAGINRSAVDRRAARPAAAQRLGARGAGGGGHPLLRHRAQPRGSSREVRWSRRCISTSGTSISPIRWARRSTPGSAAAPTSCRPIRSPMTRVHFHRALKAICDRHHPTFYPRFKSWCDHYFVNTHRGDERRGIGGVSSTTCARATAG